MAMLVGWVVLVSASVVSCYRAARRPPRPGHDAALSVAVALLMVLAAMAAAGTRWPWLALAPVLLAGVGAAFLAGRTVIVTRRRAAARLMPLPGTSESDSPA